MSETFKINNVVVKQIPSYPNYAVSKCGRVFRISSNKEMKRIPMGRSRYLAFRSCHNNVTDNPFIHKCVAEAWIPNHNNYSQVNHIDGDKINNHVDNLEWCTPAQNQWHAHSTGLKGRGEKLYNSSMTDTDAHLICQRLEDGWTVLDVHKSLGISKDIIRKVKAGDTYFHIRVLYNIDHTYLNDFSEKTVRWVCEHIVKGLSDSQVAKNSHNSNVKKIDVKRIRHKIRYKLISDEYF